LSNPNINLCKENVIKSFTEGESHRMYAPLTALSHSIVYHFYGLNPKPYILVNLIIHLCNILLLFVFISLITKNPYVPVIIAALFALHPMQVESVAYAAGRRDVLYAFFYLLCLILYIRSSDRKKHYVIQYILSIIFALLALFSKGQAITIPVTIILISLLMNGKWKTKSFWLDKLPFIILSLVIAYKVFSAPQFASGGFTSTAYLDSNVPVLYRIICAIYGFIQYIILLLVPYKLSLVHPYPMTNGVYFIPYIYYFYVIIFFGLVYFFFRFAIRKKFLWFGLAFFAVNIFMLLQLIPNSYGIMNDHYVYFAGTGIFFIIGNTVTYKFLNKKYLAALYIIFSIYFIILGCFSYQRIHVFKDSITIWSDVIKKYPGCSVAYNNRGSAYIGKGLYEEAFSDIQKAIEIKPDYTEAYLNRGNLYEAKGSYDKAIIDYTKAIEIKPDYSEAYNNRGNAYNAERFYDKAISDLTKAIELKPDYAKAYNNRGLVYQVQGRYDKAVADYSKTIELKPDYAKTYKNRGLIYQAQGFYDKAIVDYSNAVKYKPDYAEAYYNRGVNYDNMKLYDKALDDYTKAIELKKDYVGAYLNRGAIYISKASYDKAIADFTKAIELNPVSDEAYNNRGFAFTKQNLPDKAIIDLTKALELNPDNSFALNNRGCARFHLADYTGALDDYDKSIKISDANPFAYYNRGELYLNLKKYSAALNDLNKCIQLDATINDAYSIRGLIYLKLNNQSNACSDFKKAVNLGSSAAKDYVAKFCK